MTKHDTKAKAVRNTKRAARTATIKRIAEEHRGIAFPDDTQPKKGKSVISHQQKAAWNASAEDALDAALRTASDGENDWAVQVAHENRVTFKWAHLNPGMQRMNLGNVLRGKLRRGEKVQVEGVAVG